jgi:hypothetical protein
MATVLAVIVLVLTIELWVPLAFVFSAIKLRRKGGGGHHGR